VATYATPDALRAELGVDESSLSDEDANRLIVAAEDLIDAELNQLRDENDDPRPIDEATGRKVTQSLVDEWRWMKLASATVLVAALLYQEPDAARGRQWKRERGPAFEFDGPRGHDLGRRVVALLAATGWYRSRLGSVSMSNWTE
jgi:hypothetical protein